MNFFVSILSSSPSPRWASARTDSPTYKSGGTIQATCKLVEKLEGEVVGILIMIELGFLNGRDKLKDYDLFTLIRYD